jgi:hypothetical protein
MIMVAEDVYKFRFLGYNFIVFVIIKLNLTNLQYRGMFEPG